MTKELYCKKLREAKKEQESSKLFISYQEEKNTNNKVKTVEESLLGKSEILVLKYQKVECIFEK